MNAVYSHVLKKLSWLQGSNKYLRAMSIFAMPMIPFGEPDAVQCSTRQGGRNDRMGIGTVYSKISRLVSVNTAPDMFDRVFEPRPATRLPLGPRTIAIHDLFSCLPSLQVGIHLSLDSPTVLL